MKFKFIFIIFFLLISIVYSKNRGLHLGNKQYFKGSGDFNITVISSKDDITIKIPSLEAHKRVVYRSIKKEGPYHKIKLLKDSIYIDKSIKRGIKYYYVVVIHQKLWHPWKENRKHKDKDKVKEKGAWKWGYKRSNIASGSIKKIIKNTMVHFNSKPDGAKVFINNKEIGKTPVKKKIGFGTYELIINKKGYQPYQNKNFKVEKRDKKEVKVVLKKKKAILKISSTPSGAEIKLNDKVIGKTPVTKDNLSFGKYKIHAALKGYKKNEKEIHIKADKPTAVNFILKKKIEKGDLKISSKPEDAEVYIDNMKKGNTTLILKDLKAGSYSLILKKKGYNDLKKEIEVEAKKTKIYKLFMEIKGGNLTITSFPSKALVKINKKDYGITPFVSDNIRPGDLNISIRKSGFKLKTDIVKIKPEEKKVLSYKLDPVIVSQPVKDVKVIFNSKPKGATVIIDNQNIGITPVSKKFKLGTYQLTMQKHDYKTHKNYNFVVDYKPKININVTLEKKKAVLQITSIPQGADIKLNRKNIGKTPVSKDNLTFGKYNITASLKGYNNLKEVIIIDKEIPPLVNLVFKKKILKGVLKINSVPKGANIYINNIYKGITPIVLKKMRAGINTLLLKKKGYNEIKNDIEVEANKTKIYNFSLSKRDGYLNVTTFPDNADLYLNNKLIGKTPFNSYKIEKGSYNLIIKKDNYSDFHEMLDVKVNDNIKRDIILSKKKSVLSISSFPDKACLIINGMNYGITPFISDNIQPGNIKLTITKPEFEDKTAEFFLNPGEKKDLSYNLKPIVQQQVVVVKKGTLSVSSIPANASVYINNSFAGQSPLMISKTPGKYSISVRKNNYKDWNGQAVIKAESTERLYLNLTPLESYLSINSSPLNAKVYLNDIFYGNTPTRFKITAGNHIINLKKEDYKVYSTSLYISGKKGEVSKTYRMAKDVKTYNFNSIPDKCEVIMNNRIIGITSFQLIDIHDGPYNIIFRKTGYRDWQKSITFYKGNPDVVNAKLDPLKGDLLINSEPASCELYIDNNRKGKTGRTIRDIHAGYHNVTLKKYGYYNVSGKILIKDKKLSTYSFKLIEKPKGDIQVDTIPQGANIYLNMKLQGITPKLLTKIPEDEYKVKLKKSGYKSFYTTAYVKGNQTEYIKAQLVEGSDCCLGDGIITKPAFWYILSGVCLAGSGYAWYEEERALKDDNGKRRSDMHRVRNGLAFGSGGCLLIGITMHILN